MTENYIRDYMRLALVDEKLKKHTYTRTDRDNIYDAVMALDSAMPLIL